MPEMSCKRWHWLILIAPLAVGCGNQIVDDGSSSGSTGTTGAGGSGGEGGSDSGPLCEKQHDATHDGKKVIVCDDTFASIPWVHLPPSAVYTDYLTVDCNPEVWKKFWFDRSGIGHGGVGDFAPDSFCAVPGNSIDSAFGIYKVTVDDDSNVIAAKLWAMVDESNMLKTLVGTPIDGVVSSKDDTLKGMGKYVGNPDLSIEVVFGAPELVEAHDDGTSRYSITAQIENLDTNLGEGSSCIPALSQEQSPFTGKTAGIRLSRSIPDYLTHTECLVDGTSLGIERDAGLFASVTSVVSHHTVMSSYLGYPADVHDGVYPVPVLYLNATAGVVVACDP